ncbi:Protein FAR1-RELATED SEQUENCE 4 [Bienertia sinuspersici]
MVFLILDDLDIFFRRYAKQQGFGIVKAGGAYKQEKGKTLNERRNCTWKFESGGKPDARIRASSRVLNGVSGKGVKMAIEKQRKLDARLFQHHDEGVSIPQIHSALAAERSGVENFPVSERQLRNVVDKERRLKMMEGDANAMAAYFHRMSTDNQNFFHLHKLDDDECLNVMWVDARSRAAYIEFGYVVCFDSTYLTNSYTVEEFENSWNEAIDAYNLGENAWLKG